MVSTNVCAVQDTAAPILLKAAPVSFIEIKMREILIFNFLFMFRNLHLPTEIGVGKHQQDHVAFRQQLKGRNFTTVPQFSIERSHGLETSSDEYRFV